MLNTVTTFLALSAANSFSPLHPISTSSRLHQLQTLPHPSSQFRTSLTPLLNTPSNHGIFSSKPFSRDIACDAIRPNRNRQNPNQHPQRPNQHPGRPNQHSHQPSDPSSCPLEEFDPKLCELPNAEKSKKRSGFIEDTRHRTIDSTLRREVYSGFNSTELTPENVLVYRSRDCRKELSKIPAGIQVKPVSIGNIQAEWLIPTNTKNLNPKTGLYFFGGAYVIGNPTCHRAITGNIARLANMPVLASDYRKVPENSYPAALQDAMSAYNHLLSEGLKPEEIVIMGDSSGGHLALSLALEIQKRHPDHKLGGLVLISPWTDMTLTSETLKTKAATDPVLPAHRMPEVVDLFTNSGKINPKDPRVSPLYDNLSKLPPLLIHVGENEILLNDSTNLAVRAHEAGVPTQFKVWTDMPHIFHILHDFVPESKEALQEVAQFIKHLA
jgi:epsilon-lactone hydrolase